MEMRTVKWTTEGMVKARKPGEYSMTSGHTSVAGSMMVLRQVQGSFPESRWHRDIIMNYTVLDYIFLIVEGGISVLGPFP